MVLFVVIAVVLVAVIVAVIALGRVRQRPGQSHTGTIREALIRLLTRQTGAFVIIEEPYSGKFVQFAGSKDEPLLLDLPSQTLSPDELAKVRTIFVELGYPGSETDQTPVCTGGPAAEDRTSFNMEFGTDTDKAAEFAVSVLHRVYGLGDDAELKLTEE